MSNATNLRSNSTRIEEMDVDQVLVLGKGLWDHDHPIPRILNMRSRASRNTFGIVNGRLIGAECWPSTGELYLLSGSFATVQARDLRTTLNNQPWAVSRLRKNETMFGEKSHHQRKVPVTEPGRTFESQCVCHRDGHVSLHCTFPSLPQNDGKEGEF